MAKKSCQPTTLGNSTLQNIFNRRLLDRVVALEPSSGNTFAYDYVSEAGTTATIGFLTLGRQIVGISNTGLVTITLGSIAANGQMEITFKDEALNDNSLDIIINPDAADTLDGNTTLRYSRNGSQKGSAITIYNNNINEWYLI